MAIGAAHAHRWMMQPSWYGMPAWVCSSCGAVQLAPDNALSQNPR